MEKTKTSDAQKRAAMKWQKENYSRVAFDLPKEDAAALKEYCKSRGETVGAFLKRAIAETIENDAEN